MKKIYYFLLFCLILVIIAVQIHWFAPETSRAMVQSWIDQVMGGKESGSSKSAAANKANDDTGPVRIGYGYYTSGKREAFNNGIQMAVDEINQSPNAAFNGRKLEAVEVDLPSTPNPNAMWHFAQKISEQNLVATVLSAGGGGENAIIGSAVFEKFRIINLWPYTTTTKLTQHNFKYVFRNIPNNSAQAEIMAKACADVGCKNVGIVYVRSSSGEELAGLLDKHVNHIDQANVAFYQSIYPEQKDFFPIVTRFLVKHKAKPMDAIFFSGSTREAIPFITLLREFKIEVPIILGVSQNDPKFLEIGGRGPSPVIGSVVVGLFQEEDPENALFIKEYNAIFKKKLPSYTTAAQAFDSVMLLVEAMRYGRSADPDSMVSYLRYGGVLANKGKKNPRRHFPNGEILGHDYFLQIVREKKNKDGKMVLYFDTYRQEDQCIFKKGVSCMSQPESGAAH
ncbi:MAG: ABC transporter substrate-binding protein [Magnetococcales bacterium]|nr:ABC transporter substrate-binding protein [Magnetococcales bacterium]